MAKTVEDVLHELSSRFLLNVSDEEFRDTIRIGFQMEQAHWWYIDYYSSHVRTGPHVFMPGQGLSRAVVRRVC
eukprot:m.111283 g.111283  ORF g.111283 m.111283 type:complete len:73 (-) comp9085_c0_seq3:117-335(-)